MTDPLAQSIRSLLIPIVRQNLTETGSILTQHINDGATSSSALLSPADIPNTLDPAGCPNHPPCTIRVIKSDVLTAAISILRPEVVESCPNNSSEDDEEENDASQEGYLLPDEVARGKTMILNTCSGKRPGGGYTDLLISASQLPAHPLPLTPCIPPNWQDYTTKEESLCLATTLHTTLNPAYYPLPPSSSTVIYSPGVVIFRDPITLAELPHSQSHVVSILSATVPSNRPLTPDGTEFADAEDLEELKREIRFCLRVAAMNGQERLVLGGCKSHKCPPGLAAREVKGALGEEEFRGWFREMVVVVGEKNLSVFMEVLDGVVV